MVYWNGWCCIQSTPRDDDANGAHTKDPQMDDTANGGHHVMSCELLIVYMICAEWLKMEYFTCLFSTWFVLNDLKWNILL